MNRKYALCVGINNYPGSYNDLHGCVNDALDWAELLVSQGYEVITLLDSYATKVEILSQLTHLVEKTGWADRLVFSFSGHGTWVPDYDGDEVDGRDEALCNVDFETAGFIVDDDLERIFSQLKYGSTALVLSDSCHSGTVNRFMNRQETHNRFISPTEHAGWDVERVIEIERNIDAAPRKSANLISGCADHEYSYDAWFSGRPNGAFSYAAIKTFTKGVTLDAWYERIRLELPSERYPQTPQMFASSYRRYNRAL